MTQIIARGSKDDGTVNLYARLYQRPDLNKTLALGITLHQQDWKYIDSVIRGADAAKRSGNTVVLRDALAMKLWNIKQALDAMILAGTASVETARTVIDERMHEEELAEARRQNELAAAKAAKEKRMGLLDWIREYIRQCETGERLRQKSTKAISKGTVKSYKVTLGQLEAYQEKRHKVVGFDDVTLDFYDDWRRFLLEKKDEKGKPAPYSPNTIAKHIKTLKIFLYAAKRVKLTTCNDFENSRFSADFHDVENVYLTEERVQQMYETDFEDADTVARLLRMAPNDKERAEMKKLLKEQWPSMLNESKDVFTVGCLTGQRVSDYKRINEQMYRVLSDGNEYIYLQQAKTGKWIYIPLDIRVRAILDRYGGKLPKVFDQDLNERIKIVGRLLGWREEGGIMELHGMMEVPTQKKFYECIMTHTARRTFATNAYKRKISLSSIMVITGHSSEAMLRKYLKLDKEERAIMAAAEFANAREVKLKIAE